MNLEKNGVEMNFLFGGKSSLKALNFILFNKDDSKHFGECYFEALVKISNFA